MPDFITDLSLTLGNSEGFKELFRRRMEDIVNTLLETEMTTFLGYEKHSSEGWNTGNSRNGFYKRKVATEFGELHLLVPRDRRGAFKSRTVPAHLRHTDGLEATVIQLYSHGVTTREISNLIEQMYGHHYAPATVSHMAKAVDAQVAEFHSRTVAKRYAVIYADATYLDVRRDSVAKEALHVILGITPEGYKEILDYALYPSESAGNYKEMLQGLKKRGLQEVLLFVSDGLNGLPSALQEESPKAKHRSCWVHLSRRIARLVRKSERKDVPEALKSVYRADDAGSAEKALQGFLTEYGKKYPSLKKVFERRESLFSFFDFPAEIRRSLYTSNPIESCNKNLKQQTKKKEQFPNEESLDRFVCAFYSEYNRKRGSHVQKGFKEAYPKLMEMFS